MKLLAVDTSTIVCNVCVLNDGAVDAEYVSRSTVTHTERLMPAIETLFASLSWKIHELDALAVIHGPGSFTGLRISLSVIKGLGFALQIPVIPANALEVAAHQVDDAVLISPMMDARRGEIFTCLLERKEGALKMLIPPKSVRPELWRQELPNASITFCGPGVDLYFDAVPDVKREAPFREFTLARTLAFLAQQRFAEGEAINSADLKAAYLRPSDAEVKGPQPLRHR